MSPPILLTTLGTLAQPSGMGQLREHMQATHDPLDPAQLQEIGQFLREELQDSPALAKTRFRVGPTGLGGGAYLPQQNLVSVDEPKIPVMAHELGHAKSISTASSAYKTLQSISRKLWKINTLGALPAAAAVAALIAPGAAQAQAFDRLTAISIGLAAPTLLEEAGASLDAMQHVPDKMEGLKYMVPGFATYAAMAAIPPIVYQLSKRLLRG